MYLITVARAAEAGHPEPIPMPAIAEALGVSVASANEMIRKLAGRGLLTYEPYRGSGLTASGRAVASRVLRTRRLWATFLVEHLGFGPAEADAQACHLEHVTEADAADRLAAFLGDPATDPLGHPIPSALNQTIPQHSIALDEVPVGSDAEVAAIRAPRAAADFLAAQGIAVGTRVTVLATGEAGVLIAAKDLVNLTRGLAAAIEVRALGPSDDR
ncbi:MAG: metal-dependent transcriptional regulator [Acidimicrobiia bacterium]|nr:metal-dependent transcriptional regulator [Acidimicrobiia bacterium]